MSVLLSHRYNREKRIHILGMDYYLKYVSTYIESQRTLNFYKRICRFLFERQQNSAKIILLRINAFDF